MAAKKLETVEIIFKGGIPLTVTGYYYPYEEYSNSRAEFDIREVMVSDSFTNIIELISSEDLDDITDCVLSLL